jgi:hypothetical protein
MGEKKELHSRRPGIIGRPPPPDFAIHRVRGASKRELQIVYTVAYETVHRWWNDPDVLREMDELNAEIKSLRKAELLGLATTAVETLKDVMGGEHPPARVKAAEIVLRYSGVGDDAADGQIAADGSIEEQARMVLATAAMILRDRGAVGAAALVEAERDKIVPDAELNIITDAEVGDE